MDSFLNHQDNKPELLTAQALSTLPLEQQIRYSIKLLYVFCLIEDTDIVVLSFEERQKVTGDFSRV